MPFNFLLGSSSGQKKIDNVGYRGPDDRTIHTSEAGLDTVNSMPYHEDVRYLNGFQAGDREINSRNMRADNDSMHRPSQSPQRNSDPRTKERKKIRGGWREFIFPLSPQDPRLNQHDFSNDKELPPHPSEDRDFYSNRPDHIQNKHRVPPDEKASRSSQDFETAQHEKLFRWIPHIRQSEDDRGIVNTVQPIFVHSEQHIMNFYLNGSVPIQPNTKQNLEMMWLPNLPAQLPLVDLLSQTRNQTAVIKHCLIYTIICMIHSESDLFPDSLLPLDFSQVGAMHKRSMGNNDDIPYLRQAMSAHRLLCSYLHPNITKDQGYIGSREKIIEQAVNKFDDAFYAWHNPGKSPEDRRENLKGLLRQAGDRGILLFSQASVFDFDWSLANDKTHEISIVTRPRLVKLYDEDGNKLDPFQVISEAKVEIISPQPHTINAQETTPSPMMSRTGYTTEPPSRYGNTYDTCSSQNIAPRPSSSSLKHPSGIPTRSSSKTNADDQIAELPGAYQEQSGHMHGFGNGDDLVQDMTATLSGPLEHSHPVVEHEEQHDELNKEAGYDPYNPRTYGLASGQFSPPAELPTRGTRSAEDLSSEFEAPKWSNNHQWQHPEPYADVQPPQNSGRSDWPLPGLEDSANATSAATSGEKGSRIQPTFGKSGCAMIVTNRHEDIREDSAIQERIVTADKERPAEGHTKQVLRKPPPTRTPPPSSWPSQLNSAQFNHSQESVRRDDKHPGGANAQPKQQPAQGLPTIRPLTEQRFHGHFPPQVPPHTSNESYGTRGRSGYELAQKSFRSASEQGRRSTENSYTSRRRRRRESGSFMGKVKQFVFD